MADKATELFDDAEVIEDSTDPLKDAPETDTPDDILAMLSAKELDGEALAKDQADLYLEAGDYFFKKGHTVSIANNAKDRHAQDLLPHGRTMVNVSGQVQHITSSKVGMFRFSFSPDKRYAKDQEGNIKQPETFDMFYQTWLKVNEFFFKKYERRAKNVGEVIAMLKSGSYLMYITRSKQGGNFFNSLKEM